MANKIEILRTYQKGVSFEEALKLAKDAGKPLVTNRQIDAILQDDELRTKYPELFRCWTGTITIHPEAGKPLGEYVNTNGLIFEIPKEQQGLKETAIVLEAGTYSIEDFKYGLRILKPTELIIQDFPDEDGWYKVNPQTGVPTREKSAREDKDARYLWRYNSAGIRPLSRGVDFYFYRRGVYCYDDFVALGVASIGSSQAKPDPMKMKPVSRVDPNNRFRRRVIAKCLTLLKERGVKVEA